MSKIKCCSVPAPRPSLAVSPSTRLRADPALDPVLLAIEAVVRATADQSRAGSHYSALENAHRTVAFYQPRVLVGRYTSMEGPDSGTVYPIYANCEAQIRSWTHGPHREAVIADLVAKLEADRARNLHEQEALGIIAAEKASGEAMERFSVAETAVLNAEPTTHVGAIALALFAAQFVDENGDDADILAVLRTLAAFMVRTNPDRAHARAR